MGRLLLEIKELDETVHLSSEEKMKKTLPLIKETDLAFKAINSLEETYLKSETLQKMKYEGKYGLPNSYKLKQSRKNSSY